MLKSLHSCAHCVAGGGGGSGSVCVKEQPDQVGRGAVSSGDSGDSGDTAQAARPSLTLSSPLHRAI